MAADAFALEVALDLDPEEGVLEAAAAAVAAAAAAVEEATGRDALLLPGEGRYPTSLTRTMPGTEKIESAR